MLCLWQPTFNQALRSLDGFTSMKAPIHAVVRASLLSNSTMVQSAHIIFLPRSGIAWRPAFQRMRGRISFPLLCWQRHWCWALCWEQQPTSKWARTRYGLPWPSPRSWRSPSSVPET